MGDLLQAIISNQFAGLFADYLIMFLIFFIKIFMKAKWQFHVGEIKQWKLLSYIHHLSRVLREKNFFGPCLEASVQFSHSVMSGSLQPYRPQPRGLQDLSPCPGTESSPGSESAKN